jgi:tRNA threonylcarbamoyladenosine biosynthesis protein TsaE
MRVKPAPNGLVVDTSSEAQTAALGAALAALLEPGTVIGLEGPLGAGKTLLVRALAEALDVDPATISSPTFVLIHEYEGRLPIFHFDAYRLASPAQFEALGPADYFGAGGVCVVEWADRVQGLLPADAWTIHIEPLGPRRRRFALGLGQGPEAAARSRRLKAALAALGSFDEPRGET